MTYSNEANAQFAKEAMAHQSLDHNEILNVRWATIDPNPMAQSREKRRIEEQAAEAIRKALPKEYVDEIEGRVGPGGGNKKRRLDGGFDDLEGYVMPEDVWYAREKASLQNTETQGMLEGVPEGYTSGVQQEESGLLSSGALQALEKLRERSSQGGTGVKVVNPVAPAQPTGLPLVGYGSDSDED